MGMLTEYWCLSALPVSMFCCCLLLVELLTFVASSVYHDYCIIGAGPSGLQMGHFLQHSNRDYVIFEKSNNSGNFFVIYPRHRTLISINKRYTGKTNREFNLRHDWNSLLSDDDSLLFKHYSKEMFPNADDYLIYLRDYSKKLKLNIQFQTEVRNIGAIETEKLRSGRVFAMEDQAGNSYTCRTVICATGISTPNIPRVNGIEFAEGYESISTNPDDYEGETVLILGRGNSAFETANSIYGSTNLIHMVGRSRVRLAWATHYVGDLRAVNNALLDTYQLKSLDGLLESTLEEIKIVKRGDKYHLVFTDEDDSASYFLDNFALREPYDRVIRCLGFHFDNSIFRNKTKLSQGTGRGKKYPAIKHNYESADVPGMFFSGSVTHSLDHRKSAGGFIHGFRYTARALHHLLEWRYHQVPWPSQTVTLFQLMNVILKRLNEASGPYQMFGMLGDVITLNKNSSSFEYLEEFPVNLLDNFKNMSGHHADSLIVVVLQYGANFSGPGKDIFRIDRATGEPSEAHHSNFLHPVLYYYETIPTEKQMNSMRKDEVLPRPTAVHHIVEDFLTTWDAPVSHILPLRRFLENIFGIDLKNYFADTCFKLAMTYATVPASCDNSLNERDLLTGTKSLWEQARIAGLTL